jgi:acyl-CoA thioesterase-1
MTLLRLPSLIFILLLTVVAPAQAEPQPAKPAEKPVLLILGDSLSAGYGLDAQTGYVALLQRRLDSEGYNYHVVNASVSGDTTAGGLTRLPPALDRYRPAIVLIELGGNDGLRALPLKALHDNLGKLVEMSQAAKAKVLLFEIRIPPNYGAVYTDGFAGTFSQVAAERKVPMIPFFLLSLVGVPGAFQDDGIHPAAVSQPKMVDAIWPSLKPLLR